MIVWHLCHCFVEKLNEKPDVVDQHLLITANRKQQNTKDVLFLVENCDTMLVILHKHNPFERIRGLENCDVRVFFVKVFRLAT